MDAGTNLSCNSTIPSPLVGEFAQKYKNVCFGCLKQSFGKKGTNRYEKRPGKNIPQELTAALHMPMGLFSELGVKIHTACLRAATKNPASLSQRTDVKELDIQTKLHKHQLQVVSVSAGREESTPRSSREIQLGEGVQFILGDLLPTMDKTSSNDKLKEARNKLKCMDSAYMCEVDPKINLALPENEFLIDVYKKN